MQRIIVSIIFISFFIISLEGCVYLTHYKETMLLKKFADNEREMDDYIKRQEELFNKLEDHIRNNRLRRGLAQKKILAAYGEPVFCRKEEGRPEAAETCFYRHPLRYFSTDMIYLDFDINRRLYSWELIKADNG